jgi:hypothetical protein
MCLNAVNDGSILWVALIHPVDDDVTVRMTFQTKLPKEEMGDVTPVPGVLATRTPLRRYLPIFTPDQARSDDCTDHQAAGEQFRREVLNGQARYNENKD